MRSIVKLDLVPHKIPKKLWLIYPAPLFIAFSVSCRLVLYPDGFFSGNLTAKEINS